jgi:AAA domain-containing protein
VPTPPSQRSVKISSDERGGWSSDRPRREGGPARPADISVRCRVLDPADRLRYAPGSLLLIASPAATERDRFAERVLEDPGSLLSLEKIRGLLAGRVPQEEVEARAAELLEATARKRLAAGVSVAISAPGLAAEERERYARMAAEARRPRHLVLLEVGRDQVRDEDRAPVNELRRRLDAGELGAEGFATALRLGGNSGSEVKRILFRPPPRDDD